MVSIKWCLNQKNGLELVDPNSNMSNSYIKMAEESIKILDRVKESDIWTATTSYYIFYYSLYSLMLEVGVKCEIHSCSIEFMKNFLMNFYDLEDFNNFEKAFSARTDLQYYTNRPVDKKTINEGRKNCKDFFLKTKEILSKITENEIKEIRTKLKKIK